MKDTAKQVINCAGKMTYLGGSRLSSGVIAEMREAGRRYIEMKELHAHADSVLSKIFGSEKSMITTGSAGAIAISIAACITRNSFYLVEKVPFVETTRKKVIVQSGHCINFGASLAQMIHLGGGKIVQIGDVNKTQILQLQGAIDSDVAAIVYVKSHHALQEGMLSLEEVLHVATVNKIPVILDAAAEEDVQKYITMGCDLVIVSGTKAFSGPTSGIITGKEECVAWCELQQTGIGRALKVGKETIFGLLVAVNEYTTRKVIHTLDFKPLMSFFERYSELECSLIDDALGRNITRLRLEIKEKTNFNARILSSELKRSTPAIYTRDHHTMKGYVEFDPRPMQDADIPNIIETCRKIFSKYGVE